MSIPSPPRVGRTGSEVSSKSRKKQRRVTSISVQSDGASEYGGGGQDYYSGLEEGSSDDDDDSDEDDDLLDLDFGDDMPVTGFAVASNRRNADFHELFPNIPDGDYLIEGCIKH